MPSYRETFTKIHKPESKAELNNKALHKSAENLENVIKDRIAKRQELADKGKEYGDLTPVEEIIIITPHGIGDMEELKSSSGYKKLHECCAAPAIDMKVQIAKREVFVEEFREVDYIPCIVITMDRPYSESPDAHIHGKAQTPQSKPDKPKA